jgi:aminoglycoside 6-adenylyltransferase
LSENLIAAMDALEARFTDWARQRKDVRAAIVVGSRARTDHPADEWADLDVAILTTAPANYHRDTGWIAEIAHVWAVSKDASGVTYHVLFAGGRDAGIAVIPASPVKLATRAVPFLRKIPSRAIPFGLGRRIESELQGAAAYTSRGYRVLFDKDGMAERFFSLFPTGAMPAPQPPTAAEFSAIVNEFWFVAVWTAKHLWRGETWRARSVGLEGRMKDALLQMVEWHARAKSSIPLDTWEGGRFIQEWASPEVLSALAGSFAGYDASACEQALAVMMDTFARLSAETGRLLGYDHLSTLGQNVTDWIAQNGPR